MRNSTFLTLLYCFIGFTTSAQIYDAKVTTAVVMFNQAQDENEFQAVIKKLDEVIEHIDEVKEKNQGKAYWYRAKARLKLFLVYAKTYKSAAAQGMDFQRIYDDLQEARGLYAATDPEITGIQGSRMELQRYLVGVSADLFSTNMDRSLELLQMAENIEPSASVADMLSQVYIEKKDYTKAEAYLKQAINLYDNPKNPSPEFQGALVYYRRALLHILYLAPKDPTYGIPQPTNEQIATAKKSVESGLAFIRTADAKYNAIKAQIPKMTQYSYEGTRSQAKRSLVGMQAELAISYAPQEEAVATMESICADFPTEAVFATAYAGLLEKSDPDKAIAEYERALVIDPSFATARFNLGAMFINQASDLSKQQAEMSDLDKISEIDPKINTLFKQARPHFEHLAVNPDVDPVVIDQLMIIALRLEDMDAYEKWKKRKGN